MTDFNITNIMNIISQTLFGGNNTLAGLCMMMACFFVGVVIISKIGAPPTYALVPMIPLAIIFGTMGIMDPTVAVLIVIVTSVVMAAYARHVVEGK